MMKMKRLVNFFNKPPLPFDRILILGFCELVLIVLREEHGRFYGLTNAIYHALFFTLMLAVLLQLIRLINELRRDK